MARLVIGVDIEQRIVLAGMLLRSFILNKLKKLDFL
jgi:hypothetical protein